jgi:hypothetical protein
MAGGGQGRPGRVVVEWAASVGGPAGADLPAGQAVVCDLLAGDAACDAEAWLRIADVIICRPGPAAGLSAVLRSALSRYPGCAVAAAGLNGGACLMSAPGHDPVRITAERGDGPLWPGPLACAAFAHSWLVAGLPLRSLHSARLRAVSPGPDGTVGLAGRGMVSALVQRELCIRRPGLA